MATHKGNGGSTPSGGNRPSWTDLGKTVSSPAVPKGKPQMTAPPPPPTPKSK